jgi:mono/diheme cytochrome c family protein
MTLTLIACCVAGMAFGQRIKDQRLQAKVPYEFSVGSQVLPAGTYSFYMDGPWLAVRSETGGPFRDKIIYEVNGPAELLDDGSLVFDKTGDKRVLSEVWIPGMNGLVVHSIPANDEREVLLATYLNETRPTSGKAAYGLTCAKCHGPQGNGDEKADKYFNTTIPRLSSPAVQGKSDAELKQIISQGTSVMPPVEIGESGFRHRLPPQDVDAVIAYVRTLKR